MVTLEVDTSQFNIAARYVFEETRKTLPDIINRAALTTLIGGRGVTGAMKRTRKASRAAIRAVPVERVAGYVMHKHKGVKFTRIQIREIIRREYARRIAAIGYTANVGWNNAVVDLGGHGVGGSRRSSKGLATGGFGRKASPGNFSAEVVNTAPAAAMIGWQPLQEAINETARDMIAHIGGEFDKVIQNAYR